MGTLHFVDAMQGYCPKPFQMIMIKKQLTIKLSRRSIMVATTLRQTILYLAIELSNSKWKLFFSNGEKIRSKSISARDLDGLSQEIEAAKKRFKLNEDVSVISCYEAGRDGFWIHRHLTAIGVDNWVVDAGSIEVDRRMRRAKTDRIDGKALLRKLISYCNGDHQVWSVVRIPSLEEEDARRVHRELERLNKERGGHRNRIRSLLVLHGVAVVNWRGFEQWLEQVRCFDGQQLPAEIRSELAREYERLQIVEQQIKGIEKRQGDEVAAMDTDQMRKVAVLKMLNGIGERSSWVFVMEFFGWRQFSNRGEVGAASGLCPTPYASGAMERQLGISKGGNRRVRSLAIEIAWCWIRYQPRSKLTRWFQDRFAGGGKRMRRVGIVAVARQLLIDLWRLLEQGRIPEGAQYNPELMKLLAN
jgi:transposase